MEEAFIAEFIALGIPFFCINPELVVENDSLVDALAKGVAPQMQAVTKRELNQLKLRMIQHLEDLYKD